MLTHLTIKNYALIKHLEFEPSAHLNVITGETGAGKSIMLGAIGLLLGNRADSKTLWEESEKCITEGIFHIGPYQLKDFFDVEELDYAEQTIIRREISAAGKSRAFINDTPVTLEVLRKLGSKLMDVHSQHETLELGSKSFQLKLVDSYAGNEKLLHEYKNLWRKFTDAEQGYEQLLADATVLKKESDFIQFQLKELTQANLQVGELERLESELRVLEHAEEIKTQFNSILEQFDRSEFSIRTGLSAIRNQLQSVSSYSAEYEKLLQRLESARIELDDIVHELQLAEEKIDFDPHRTEEIKERVSVLYQLQQKHRTREIHELIEMRETLQQKADKHHNLDALLLEAKEKLEKSRKDVEHAAQVLSQSRKKVLGPLSKQLKNLLQELGMVHAEISVEQSLVPPGHSGIDSIEILFSANKGVSPKPLALVASGGEFARVMFSLKYILAEKSALPTLLLDEIDSGVSGEVAIRLGMRMKEMAKHHQVIAISHLPQIAAKADTHFFVYKEDTASRSATSLKKLSPEERITEIAKMIGGAKPTALTLENARELLNQ